MMVELKGLRGNMPSHTRLFVCLHLPLLVFLCDFASDLSILGSSEDKDCVVGSKGPCVPTQKSYTSSETFKTFDQHQEETRFELGLHMYRWHCYLTPSAMSVS